MYWGTSLGRKENITFMALQGGNINPEKDQAGRRRKLKCK